jgi:hypothetical protein
LRQNPAHEIYRSFGNMRPVYSTIKRIVFINQTNNFHKAQELRSASQAHEGWQSPRAAFAAELTLEFRGTEAALIPFPLQDAKGDQATRSMMELCPLGAGRTIDSACHALCRKNCCKDGNRATMRDHGHNMLSVGSMHSLKRESFQVQRRGSSRLALIWGFWMLCVLTVGPLLCADHADSDTDARAQWCVALNNVVVQGDEKPFSQTSPSLMVPFDTIALTCPNDHSLMTRLSIQRHGNSPASTIRDFLPVLQL